MGSIILWVLALFGLWNLISKAVDSLYIDNRSGSVEVIVKVRNQERIVESLIKSLRRINLIGKITFVDMNSTDNTLLIVKKIQDTDPVIEVQNDG